MGAIECDPLVPETNVLAIASHVVSGNVGNKVAVFALQSMGCEVAALNTVQFSNHTGYHQWKGTRLSAEELRDLWDGLKQSHLDSFDMMLSGYLPGAAAVEAVGSIARELRSKAEKNRTMIEQQNGSRNGVSGINGRGSFFWVLDPVMGDNGKLYVAEDVVPAYQKLVRDADLILPNQFEAELLSNVKITNSKSLRRAVEVLHERYGIPHVVITSVSIPLDTNGQTHVNSATTDTRTHANPTMSVVGSTRTSNGQPRLFRIHFPVFDGYFSGTGDMFAALMVARLREAVFTGSSSLKASGNPPSNPHALANTPSWISPDDVDTLDLPLTHAAEKVLASMHEVLERTSESMVKEMETLGPEGEGEGWEKRQNLFKSRAAELKLVRNLNCLLNPVVEYWAERL